MAFRLKAKSYAGSRMHCYIIIAVYHERKLIKIHSISSYCTTNAFHLLYKEINQKTFLQQTKQVEGVGS